MQCHTLPQPPPVSGRSPEKSFASGPSWKGKHQDSVCVCVCVCMGIHTCVCTGIRAGWEDKKAPHFSPDEMIARGGIFGV